MAETLADRFVLQELLGQGAMGQVFAAHDRRDDVRVAVKRLHRGGQESDVIERLRREAAILRAAAHPGIVRVLAVVDDGGDPAIVMEFVGGGTLDGLIAADGPLPVERVLRIGLDLCDALARAHQVGVIHRDLKPANILLADDGTPRITDFGIATIAGAERLTAPGVTPGTLAYLPPEAFDGSDRDARGDLWALGVILYECLAGRLPFDASHPGALMVAICEARHAPLATLRDDVPPDLARVVDALLEKDPGRRLASAREAGVLLERLLRGAPASAPPTRRAGGRFALPAHPTPLVGRDREVADLIALLREPSTRLVTVTGTGGTGKTRLAAEAARRIADRFDYGASFVDLTTVSDPSLVVPMIAQAVEVEEDPARPTADIVRERLAAESRLVVLDNFEQVVDAAAEVASLVPSSGTSRVIVTSRFLLRVDAERELPLAPLADAAVDLFVERARAANPRFTLTAANRATIEAICRRLDGLPLAIELAAARARVLDPDAMLRHLDRPLALLTSGGRDRPDHQRTLRATVEWSHRLLTDDERLLFQALSVFVGPFVLGDVEALAPALGDDWELLRIVDALQGLIEKSFVRAAHDDDQTRYGILDTLRAFGEERLAADPSRALVVERHARHFLAMARALGDAIPTPGQAGALAAFARNLGNLRSALAWAEQADPGEFAAAAGALGPCWYLSGLWSEALRWYERALRGPGIALETRAVVLDHRARLEMFLGDESAAVADHRAAVEAGAQAPPALRSRLLEGLGEVSLKIGRTDDAFAALEEARHLARASGEPNALAEALTTLGTAFAGSRRYVDAEHALAEARLLAAGQGNVFVLTKVHYYLGGLALLRGDAESSRALCLEGRAIAADSGDSAWVFHLDEMLARALMALGVDDEARILAANSLAAFHAVGSRSCLPHSLEALARYRLERGGPRALSEAAMLLGAADAVCEALSIAMLPVERALFEATKQSAAARLSAADFDAAWAAGRALSEEQAIALSARQA